MVVLGLGATNRLFLAAGFLQGLRVRVLFLLHVYIYMYVYFVRSFGWSVRINQRERERCYITRKHPPTHTPTHATYRLLQGLVQGAEPLLQVHIFRGVGGGLAIIR